jgi:phosphoserine phosphatase
VNGAENSTGRIAAFFDVDHTLIAFNSARKWVEYLWRNDKISAAAALRSVWWLVKYRLSVLDYEQVTTEVVRDYSGQSVDELGVEVEAWFHHHVEPMICVEGRQRVEWHRNQDHVLVMLTSGTFLSVAPLQRILDSRSGSPRVSRRRSRRADSSMKGPCTARHRATS